jgi:hypothetical protein
MRGRKRNPFLIKRYAPKTYPYIWGRIYEYDYFHSEDIFRDQWTIYLDLEEIKELNKEEDIENFVWTIRKDFYGEFYVSHDIPVKFTKEEFMNFKRTKIIENNLKKE